MRKEREGKLNRFIERTVTEMDTSDAKESSSESLTARRSMIDVTFQQNDDDIFGVYEQSFQAQLFNVMLFFFLLF